MHPFKLDPNQGQRVRRDRKPFTSFRPFLLLLLGLTGCAPKQLFAPEPYQLTAHDLAVIINLADPLSVQIGQYYQKKRQIPQENILSVRFPKGKTILTSEEFKRLKTELDATTPAHIQAYALTWAAPYRVGCQSITSAFAFGFDPRYCAKGCWPTQVSSYFNQTDIKPYDQLQVRPTMAIAATNFAQARALIDRGVAADGKATLGTAYLMNTSDKARNVRSALYPLIQQTLKSRFLVEILPGDTLTKRFDVMFYFTGLSQVKEIQTNHFWPGAIADHLTSLGGMLTDSPQMSSLRWLEAGATGSYGTVVEPCNFPQKFPNPAIVLRAYLSGNTLIEAYWKSVAMPGQGVFIGEPLARPFRQ